MPKILKIIENQIFKKRIHDQTFISAASNVIQNQLPQAINE
jgi:hypothetical protein